MFGNTHTSSYLDVRSPLRIQNGVKINELPVLWQRGSTSAAPVPEIVPPLPPTLDAGAAAALVGVPALLDAISFAGMLLSKGYRPSDECFIRVGEAAASRPQKIVELWYMENGEAQHVAGVAYTVRDAYAQAMQMCRQVANFGSVENAVLQGRTLATEVPAELEAVIA